MDSNQSDPTQTIPELQVLKSGSRQSRISEAFHLIPVGPLKIVARVYGEAAEKYGAFNHCGVPPLESINHAIGHLYGALDLLLDPEHTSVEDTEEELSHAACRCLMALDVVMKGGVMSKTEIRTMFGGVEGIDPK